MRCTLASLERLSKGAGDTHKHLAGPGSEKRKIKKEEISKKRGKKKGRKKKEKREKTSEINYLKTRTKMVN